MNSSTDRSSVCEELPEQPLVLKDSIEELVGHRNTALELARQALETLFAAESAAKRAAPQDEYAGFIHAMVSDRLYSLRTKGDIDSSMTIVQREVDKYAWDCIQKRSGLRNLMDVTAHQQMTKQLSEDPPPFTVENVTATYASLAAQAPAIFERSLVNVFKRLNTKDYRTNSAFGVTRRIILTSMFSGYGYSHWDTKRELMADLDRIFHTLDGRKPPEAGNAADAIEAAYRAHESTHTTEYFHVRMFRGNGNMHLTFRRRDLLDRANDMIARHFGETLADDTKRG